MNKLFCYVVFASDFLFFQTTADWMVVMRHYIEIPLVLGSVRSDVFWRRGLWTVHEESICPRARDFIRRLFHYSTVPNKRSDASLHQKTHSTIMISECLAPEKLIQPRGSNREVV